MIRVLLFALVWFFGLAIYYRGVAPAISQIVASFQPMMIESAPLYGELAGIEFILNVVIPLFMTGAVVVIVALVSFGRRGTSF
jgi:hypothetical protein